ncbi:MAG: cytochrome c oxidase subunit II [Terriglobia bacterium]
MLALCLQIPFYPQEASTMAPQVDKLFFFETAVLVFFTVLIFLLMIIFALKYRRKSKDEVPVQIHGDLRWELTWTGIPIIIVIICFVWGAQIFIAEREPPRDAEHVYVVGKQWMWKIQHPDGAREIDMLHIPVGVPIELIMTSQDVIHDFACPAFRVKQDVLPDRYTTEWFTATRTGRYPFYCDQYCGTFHSHMRGYVVVMPPMAYETWLSGQVHRTQSMAAAGAKLYQSYGCITCHGTGKAPPYVGLYMSKVKLTTGQVVIADDAYIHESILEPSAQIVNGYKPIMPTFQGQISEEQILDIIAYIKSLATTPGPTGVTIPPATGAKETK